MYKNTKKLYKKKQEIEAIEIKMYFKTIEKNVD